MDVLSEEYKEGVLTRFLVPEIHGPDITIEKILSSYEDIPLEDANGDYSDKRDYLRRVAKLADELPKSTFDEVLSLLDR